MVRGNCRLFNRCCVIVIDSACMHFVDWYNIARDAPIFVIGVFAVKVLQIVFIPRTALASSAGGTSMAHAATAAYVRYDGDAERTGSHFLLPIASRTNPSRLCFCASNILKPQSLAGSTK